MITGITQINNSTSIFILCGIIPFLITLITTFWLGELARFKRAGDYICFIEYKISLILDEFYNSKIKDTWKDKQKALESISELNQSILPLGRPMLWELWLRDVGHMRRLYYFRFLLIFFAPMIMGIYYAFENYNLELFNIINFFNLWNKNQILVLWILFITGFYLVFIYLFGFKLKGKGNKIISIIDQSFPLNYPQYHQSNTNQHQFCYSNHHFLL